MRVYLCGGINGLSDDRCKTWREYAKKHLQCETIDPMRRDYRGVEDENVKAIIEGDKADINSCDVVLVNATRPSWGTAMEVLYAWEHGKPCYSVASDSISPWLRYHSAFVFDDINKAIRAINELPERNKKRLTIQEFDLMRAKSEAFDAALEYLQGHADSCSSVEVKSILESHIWKR